MQQSPGNQPSRSIRARRTQPALPGYPVPTTPLLTDGQQVARQENNRSSSARRAAVKLLLLGALLLLVYLADYPLFAGAIQNRDAAKQVVASAFPWLPHFYWTNGLPWLAHGLSRLAPFNLATPAGNANLLLLLLLSGLVLLLLAARIGNRIGRENLSQAESGLLFWTLLLLTAVFGLVFVFAPAVLYSDVFTYALYGRMVVGNHLNPYVVHPPAGLFAGLVPHNLGVAPYGPLWMDVTLPVALFAHNSAASALVSFRLIGFIVHLANAVLIWSILARLKPEYRVAGTLLYAWNPLVLLLGVGEMHLELVAVLFVLFSIFCYQRQTLLLGWVCLLLAALASTICLLLLPLFARLFWRETRAMSRWTRSLWWLTLLGISVLIIVLAYAPYWPGWGFAGLAASLRATFLPGSAINSIDAAIIHIPSGVPVALSWFAAPPVWTVITWGTVGALLLVGMWIGDTLELILLFAAWVYFAYNVFFPVNWPWFLFLALTLAITSAYTRTVLLGLLLTGGYLLTYYFWLWPQVWGGLALVTIGVPLLTWGWALFFASTWQMKRQEAMGQPAPPPTTGRRAGFSRSPWPSFSRPGGTRRK